MVKIDYNIDDKLNPAIVGRLVEINPYSARRIYIKHKDNIIASIDVPEEIDIRTVEISVNSVKRDIEDNKEILEIEIVCIVDNEYNPYAILTGYITVKYNEEITINISTATFFKKEAIEIAI